jgi:hypothetical protein
MEWEDKICICKLVNAERYKELENYIEDKELDVQALDMILNGVEIIDENFIAHKQLFKMIIDKSSKINEENLSFRAAVRLEFIKELGKVYL